MLEVKNLSKAFAIDDSRENIILNDVSFTLNDKGFYFIIGKSGCGKSTLLNILMGLMKPDKGEVLFEGRDISKFSASELSEFLKNDIGIIFQSYNLFNGYTVKENLKVASSIKGVDEDEKVNSLLLRYGLLDKEDSLVDKLSGGEKQRLCLVRSLISSPKILFCDEPTGALDKLNSIQLMDELRVLSKKILVVCVSHNSELYNTYADGIIYLSNGHIKVSHRHESSNLVKEDKKGKEERLKSKIPGVISSRNMKKNFKYNVINAISAGFSLFLMVISLFFDSGIKASKQSLITSYGDYNIYQVSKNHEEEIEDSLVSLVKSEKPSYEEVQTLFYEVKDCLIFDDFSYFNNGEKRIINDQTTFKNFTLKPYFNKNYESNDLIVNLNFANEYQKVFRKELTIDEEIEINLKRDYLYFNEISKENVVENFSLKVKGKIREIRNEFSYLNTSIIYYSPPFYEELLKNTIAEKTSEIEKKNISYFDLLSRAKSDDQITNYSYNVVALNEETNQKIHEMIEDDSLAALSITSNSKTIVDSFLTLSTSIFLGVNIFIIISILTSIFISGFLSYSSSLRSRKQSAILSVLGAKKKDIIKIYIKEEMTYTIIGLLIGLVLTILTSNLINQYAARFFVTTSLININYLTTVFIMVLLIILNYAVDFLTLKCQKEKKIYEELKEEW